MTKAQGLPLNTIIIAILGVAILAILIAFTIGGLGANTKDLTSCSLKGGTCETDQAACESKDGVVLSSGNKQCTEGEEASASSVCCVKPNS